MSVSICGVRVHIGVLAAAAAACIVNYSALRFCAAGFLAVILHESSHLLAMRLYGCRRASVEILPGGVRIDSPAFESLDRRRTTVCLLCAPAANLVAGSLLLIVFRFSAFEAARDAAEINLALGAVNLLPLSFLDGGRALEVWLSCAALPESFRRFMDAVDLICLVVMGAAILILAFHRVYPASFYLFAVYCVIASAFSFQNKG